MSHDLIDIVREALPGIDIQPEDLDVGGEWNGLTLVAVHGDPSWIDRLPDLPAFPADSSFILVGYPLGGIVLFVRIELDARGKA
jgi:hypothetical protein